jgi:hypothetical protein
MIGNNERATVILSGFLCIILSITLAACAGPTGGPVQGDETQNMSNSNTELCSGCSIRTWFEPERLSNIYYTDEPFTVRYQANCVEGMVISDIDYDSIEEELETAESGTFYPDVAGGAAYGNAQAEGVLTGSVTYPAGSRPGRRTWHIKGSLGPLTCEQETVWQIIERPHTSDACMEYDECISNMVRRLIPLVRSNITNNASLDSQVSAFSDGKYDRKIIGLRIENALVGLARGSGIVHCVECFFGTHASGDTIILNFCPEDGAPTDYALLHEIVHIVGFDFRLINLYMADGTWDYCSRYNPCWERYVAILEQMTSTIAGEAFGNESEWICSDYD